MPTPTSSEAEEFEFRARAEAEAKGSAPGKENSVDAATQRNREISEANAQPERLPGVADAADFFGSLPAGAAKTFEGIGTAAQHPIEAVKGVLGAIPGAVSSGISALAHPMDTTQKVGEYLKNLKPQQAGETVGGMLAGGAVGKAAGVLGDVVGPSVKALVGGKPVSQEIRDLAAKGVVTTPGQRGGTKSWRDTAEQKLESLAGGQSITNRRGEAVVKWSSEKLDDALKDIGKPPVPANKSGRDALFHTKSEISNGYTALLPKLTGDFTKVAPNGSSLAVDLNQIRTAAMQKGTGMRPTDRARLLSIIDNDVTERFGKGGKADGKTLKQIDDVLDKEIKAYGAGNVSERKVADSLKEVKAKMWDMIRRENPQHAQDLKKLDTAYAKFQTAALASRIGGKGQEGAFTPNQYLRSIERRDKSKDKGRFATGTAHGQKEAESASRVLGNNVPDSGTPGRQQLIEMLKNPFGSIGGLALNAATPIAYSRPVQKYLQNRALKRGGPYTPVSGKKAATVGAILGGEEQQ